jgi:hypothetical protein
MYGAVRPPEGHRGDELDWILVFSQGSSEALCHQSVQVQDIGSTLLSGHRLQFGWMICPHPRHRHL